MEINNKIISALIKSDVLLNDGIPFLLGKHFGYESSYIPGSITHRIRNAGIYSYNDKGKLVWDIPLFGNVETHFEWVKTEYEPMFKFYNPLKGGKVREATARMKKFFAKYPDVRKEEILGAVALYFRNTDPKYIRLPHYFIEKGSGVTAESDLLDWIDKYRAIQERSEQPRDENKLLQ